jgi:predicted O-methyltransferase YrrM
MEVAIGMKPPSSFDALRAATLAAGFTMASDALTGSLLRTLASSKPGGRMLELGTGTGLSTSWLLDGMDADSTLVSVDNDDALLSLARNHLGDDDRLELVHSDGGAWITANLGSCFDLIFADTWHGKYLMLEEALSMLKAGGLYIIDDMLPQPNWPEGHAEKASRLAGILMERNDLQVTRLDWSTGLYIGVKRTDPQS